MAQLAAQRDAKGNPEMLALLVDMEGKSLKPEEIRKQIEMARTAALIGTDSMPAFIREQTGAGAGSPGSSAGMLSIAFFAESMKQSFLGESLTARAA